MMREEEEERTMKTFLIVVTTYEMTIKDRVALASYQ